MSFASTLRLPADPQTRWTLVIAAIASAFIAIGCATDSGWPEPFADGKISRSGLSIPPGQTFLLGGGQPGSFIVQAFNDGGVAVDLTPDPNPNAIAVQTIHPGSQAEATFSPGQTARLRNLSNNRTAKLKVTITSLQPDQKLGMRYVSP